MNRAYVTKAPGEPSVGGSGGCRVGDHTEVLGGAPLDRAWGLPALSPVPCPTHLFCLGAPGLHPPVTKQKSVSGLFP